MQEIIPRWEWRMFAKQVDIGTDLAAFRRTRHVDSSEIYLVAAGCDDNPKIRDGKMDIKQLQCTDADGFEQWKPVMKADFPLSATQLQDVYRTLHLPLPQGIGEPVTLDAFLNLIRQSDGARAVRVDKLRDLFEVDGCIVETAEVRFDGDPYRTLAVEDTDPKKLMDTLRKLGCSGQQNVNYVKAIKALTAQS